MTIVIIEDEQLTTDHLAKTILKADPEAQIVARLRSVKESIAWFKNNENPDLIFCDIQLGDGLSFEIFKAVSSTTPVIFCTAFDEYALNAFKVHSIDYILKPFTLKTIVNALSKYNELKNNFSRKISQYEQILQLFEDKKKKIKGSVLVYYKDKILPVRTDEIALFYIQNEITHLITFDQTKYSINKTLEELERIIGNEFYRVNRQFLINRKAIREASQYFGRKLSITLTIPFKETITVNKVKVTEFLNWLSEI
jgi:two-component system, LytTR family, response regulator LytT